MAKQTRHITTRTTRSTAHELSTEQTTPDAPQVLSPKLQAVIDALRRPFKAFVATFREVTLSRAELAPSFVEAFDVYAKETEGTFIQFCRLVDPSIPADREAYRNDPAYQAAMYLRRLVQQTAAAKPKRRGPKPATPLVALARFVATVLPLVDPSGAVWEAFIHEMHWSERQAKQVKMLGAKAGPVPMPRKTADILLHRRTG